MPLHEDRAEGLTAGRTPVKAWPEVPLNAADLDRRIRQIHVSLGEVATEDLSSVIPKQGVRGDRFYSVIDFNEGMDDAQLLNVVEKLVENVARIRDHLKVWCAQNGLPFDGDAVINNNRSVALVHDLWNTQKHAELSRQPRSGIKPQLVDVRKGLRLTAEPGGFAVFTLGPRGEPVVQSSNGRGELVIDGEIHDEHGTHVAGFYETCVDAVDHWEAALTRAGVTVPKR